MNKNCNEIKNVSKMFSLHWKPIKVIDLSGEREVELRSAHDDAQEEHIDVVTKIESKCASPSFFSFFMFAFSQFLTANQIWNILKEMSGEEEV